MEIDPPKLKRQESNQMVQKSFDLKKLPKFTCFKGFSGKPADSESNEKSKQTFDKTSLSVRRATKATKMNGLLFLLIQTTILMCSQSQPVIEDAQAFCPTLCTCLPIVEGRVFNGQRAAPSNPGFMAGIIYHAIVDNVTVLEELCTATGK